MTELLKTALSLSLSGGVLILILLAGKPLLKDRLSKRWQYYIWLVVVIRLLLPFSPAESPVGKLFEAPAPSTPPVCTVTHPGEAFLSAPSTPADIAPVPAAPAAPGDASVPAAPITPAAEQGRENVSLRLTDALGILWLAGVLVLAVRRITAYQNFTAYLRSGWEPVSDPALLDLLAETAGEAGVRRPVELCVNPLAASPMLLGLFHPVIVLPDAALPEADLRHTFLHELAHCKNGDLLYKWLVQTANCVHWFNPLVWRMAREVDRACELCCDERVIRTMDSRSRRAYGDTLLRAIGQGGGYKSSVAAVTLHESGELLKERLAAIMDFRQKTRGTAAVSLVLAAALIFGTVTAGAYTGPAKTPPASLKGDPAAGFRYTQDGYYQGGYLFEIGWNVGENAVEQYASQQMILPDGTAVDVCFDEGCRERMTDKAALQALAEVLGRIQAKAGEFPLLRALVISVREAEDTGSGEMAERLYRENSLAGFAAVFADLGEDTQRRYLERSYEDDRIAFFAACLDRIPAGSSVPGVLAEKAYQDRSVSFFSVLANRMTPAERERWLARAIGDGRANFQSVLLNTMGRYDEKEQLEQELDARQNEEYAAWGIIRDDAECVYQGQRVRIFVDLRPDRSFVTLTRDPAGSIDIKVTRDAEGSITGVAGLTPEELRIYGDRMDWEAPDANEAPDGRTDSTTPSQAVAAPALDTIELKGTTYALIFTEAQLRALAAGQYDLGRNYLQQADIRLTEPWAPIGTEENPFTGSYNGNGYEITGLAVTGPEMGLFGAAKGAHIYNIILRDCILAAGKDQPFGPVLAKDLGATRCYDNYTYPGGEPGTPAAGNTVTVPIDLPTLPAGEFHWLREYDIAPGDRLRYVVTAESGPGIQMGLVREGDAPSDRTYCMVRNNGKDSAPSITADFTVSAIIPAGKYRLFVRGPEGALQSVKGSAVLTLAQPPRIGSDQQASSVRNLAINELPAAVRQALSSMDSRRWYLVSSGGEQYLCCQGFGWSFGYTPAPQAEGWQLDIRRFQKRNDSSLYLAIPGEGPVAVTCDGESVDLTLIEA